uniref:Uncharacterized protein n=3 Tax=Meloidogyne TaxID=189290 RepID=A0A6V7UR51_MELEN|nr:unnamed protein product [Meloidogyne enterolobii]
MKNILFFLILLNITMFVSVNGQFCKIFFPQVCPLICKACTEKGCLVKDPLCPPAITFCQFFGCFCEQSDTKVQ